MELDIIVVGAGLAGLAAANGLRRAGHRVRVFEKSKFANEIGAGITVTQNSSHILKRWGFSFERAKAVVTQAIRTCDGETLKELSAQATNTGPEPVLFNIYRPDYHAELWRLAIAQDGEGPPASVTLGAEVLTADAESGTIHLTDGTTHSAELIIGADGIHSKIRKAVVPNEVIVNHTGQNAYRFMGSSEDLESDSRMKSLWATKKSKWTIYRIDDRELLFVWYDVREYDLPVLGISCTELRRGKLQNYCLLYPSEDVPLSLKGTTQEEIKKSLVRDAKWLHPDLQRVISTAQDVKPWRLVVQEPLRTWIRGNFLLVGDAAHPVHPLNGQGVNTSVEDAAALQILMRNIKDQADLAERTKTFEDLRLPRTAIIQIVSPVPAGQEKTVAYKTEPYLRGGAPILSAADRFKFVNGYDAFAAAEEALAGLSTKAPPEVGNDQNGIPASEEVQRGARGGCHYPAL